MSPGGHNIGRKWPKMLKGDLSQVCGRASVSYVDQSQVLKGVLFFQKPCRIIIGPPQYVLHLVWGVLGISTAIKTALKVALYDFLDGPPAPLNSQLMEKVYHYNWTKQIDFSMGPSVKFVLAIKDSISKKKWG